MAALSTRLVPEIARAFQRQVAHLDRILLDQDLVSSDNVFFVATGITDGELVGGVTYTPRGVETHSLVMRSKSGTVRRVHSTHQLSKLSAYSAVNF